MWWDRLREMRMREKRGQVQTWLQGRFLPRNYEQYIFFMLIIDVHMVARG